MADSIVSRDEKLGGDVELKEHADAGDLIYLDADEEPELHWKTWLALAAMCVLQYVSLFALLGPPTSLTLIGEQLGDTKRQYLVPNVVTLVQAALCPIVSSISDTFQARKTIMLACCVIALIGSAIAPGSKDIYRLIAAQVLIGVGLVSAPLGYSVPSEILPRKWRPFAQGGINFFGSIGAISAPIILGALTTSNLTKWRDFWWIQTALWGFTAVGILFGYRPPKRHTRLDHLSWTQKVSSLDLTGSALLTAGLALLITGLNIGGTIYAWVSAKVLGTMIPGIALLIAFGVYETWGTKTGILHHDLFKGDNGHGRSFALFCALFFCEGLLFFCFTIWYPVLISVLFPSTPLIQAARVLPLYCVACVCTLIYGWFSSKFRAIRGPLAVGFFVWTCGLIGFACLQPGDSTVSLGVYSLIGVGFAAPLILVVAGVQLSAPHHLMATATAVVVSSRTVGASIFVAINSAVVGGRLAKYIPAYIAKAVLPAGLPPTSLGPFIGALSTQDFAAMGQIPGVTPAVIGAGVSALQQAFADAIRVVYYIAIPFGVLSIIMCYFLSDFSSKMNYVVEAPVEDLHHRGSTHNEKA